MCILGNFLNIKPCVIIYFNFFHLKLKKKKIVELHFHEKKMFLNFNKCYKLRYAVKGYRTLQKCCHFFVALNLICLSLKLGVLNLFQLAGHIYNLYLYCVPYLFYSFFLSSLYFLLKFLNFIICSI